MTVACTPQGVGGVGDFVGGGVGGIGDCVGGGVLGVGGVPPQNDGFVLEFSQIVSLIHVH